jgi:hypothetical protein
VFSKQYQRGAINSRNVDYFLPASRPVQSNGSRLVVKSQWKLEYSVAASCVSCKKTAK